MADGDYDYSLTSSLRSSYPNVPLKVVLKVVDTFKRDREKCKQILDQEKVKYPTNEMKQSGLGIEPSSHINNDATKIMSTKIKELPVCHESTSSTAKQNLPERHVSVFEKSVVNIPRTQEITKGPTITKSISYSGPNAQFSSLSGGAHLPSTAGHTAPPDFAPFFQGIQNPTSIPNITCKTFNHDNSKAAASNQTRPNASPSSDNANRSFLPSTISAEHRRPVKVINNAPGSLSGGSVSPAGAPSNSRHFRMQFGDTGGTCTVQTNHPIQRYASTPNVSQQFRSEYRTEATVPQSVHSSSIVVATSSQSAQPTTDRRLSGEAADSEVSRTSTNPFHFSSPNISADYQPSPGAYVWEDGRPLSTPVQVSSPGIPHSRPVFQDYSRTPRVYNEASYPNYYNPAQPSAINYGSQFGADFAPSSYSMLPPTSSQEQNYPTTSHFNQQPKQNHHHGYHSPPSNLNLNAVAGVYNPPSSYTHFNPQGAGAMAYPTQQPPSRPLPYSHYPPSLNLSGVSPSHSLPRSPNTGLPHPRLSNRTNSSESSEHQDIDHVRHNHLSNMGSRVSSQSSVGSDSSMRGAGVDLLDRGRSESMHGDTEADYIRALLQHQRNCLQKLKENTEVHRVQLLKLRTEVGSLERGANDSKNNMHSSFPSPSDIARLCEKNRDLQTDIQLFVNEIEMYKSGHTLFNDINPREQQNFYANMPTGQQHCNFTGTNLDINRSSSPSRSPPPRPPPPIPVRQRSTEPTPPDLFNRVPPVPPPQPTTNSGDSEEGEQWSCTVCTFQNHPALKKCEMCEMGRFSEPKLPTRVAGGMMNSHPQSQQSG